MKLWIDKEVLVSSQNMLATFVYKKETENCVPVVELSALTELQEENARLKDGLDHKDKQYSVRLDEILKLKAELDAANACIQTIDRNLAFEKRRTFECRNCHTQMYPVFDKLALRLDKENIELRKQADKLADALEDIIKEVGTSTRSNKIATKALEQYKKWKAGK